MDNHVFYLRFSTWVRVNAAKMKEKELKKGGLFGRHDMVKYVYGEYENMPKPSTAKEADFILKFIKNTARITYEDFEKDVLDDEKDSLDVCKVFCKIATALECYCDDEDEVSDVLNLIVTLKKCTSDMLDKMLFDGKKMKLSKKKDGSDKTDDEQAQLEVIELSHIMNLMAKNGFDQIHNAWRVKRLFK